MQFKVHVRNQYASGKADAHTETYDRVDVTTPELAQEFAKRLLDNWNHGRRDHEPTRSLMGVELVGPTVNGKHEWEKTNLVTVIKDGRSFDTYECKACGMTGKRFGLGGGVIPDRSWSQRRHLNLTVCNPTPRKENTVPQDTAYYTPNDLTQWVKTADSPPPRAGLWQTSATAGGNAERPLFRLYDGALRWGPSDADPARAIERASKEGMMLTAPMYYRGIKEEKVVAVYNNFNISRETKLKEGDTWAGPNGLTYTFKRGKWVPPELQDGEKMQTQSGQEFVAQAGTWKRKVPRVVLEIDYRDIDSDKLREALENKASVQQELPLRVVTKRVPLTA